MDMLLRIFFEGRQKTQQINFDNIQQTRRPGRRPNKSIVAFPATWTKIYRVGRLENDLIFYLCLQRTADRNKHGHTELVCG